LCPERCKKRSALLLEPELAGPDIHDAIAIARYQHAIGFACKFDREPAIGELLRNLCIAAEATASSGRAFMTLGLRPGAAGSMAAPSALPSNLAVVIALS
jgi:hypothetical protein